MGTRQMNVKKSNLEFSNSIIDKIIENFDLIFYKTTIDLKKILYMSPTCEKVFGENLQSLLKEPKKLFEAFLPEDQEIPQEKFIDDLRTGKLKQFTKYRIRKPDGTISNILASSTQLKSKNNKPKFIVGAIIPLPDLIPENKPIRWEQEILRVMEQKNTINQVAPKILNIICQAFNWDLGAMWMVDEEDLILRCVYSWHKEIDRMIKYDKESRICTFKMGECLPGRVWEKKSPIWAHKFSSNEEFTRFKDAKNAGLNDALAIPIVFQDRIFGILEFFSYQIQPPEKEMLVLMHNVGRLFGEFIQRTYTNEQIQIISRNDILTGVLNRSALEEDLNKLIVKRKSKKIAIFILDIDRFRWINEALGHDAGDLLLRLIASRLVELGIHEKTYVARLGADKFIIYYNQLEHIEEILEYANKIARSLRKPFSIYNLEYPITATIGISIYPHDGLDSECLITNADLAMSHAKKEGGNRSVFFTKDLPAIALEKLMMHTNLLQAIEKNQLFLNYQPQINLSTGEICGVEALVRWQHPTKGEIRPLDFIGSAEETGVITALNEYILRLVLTQIAENWPDIPISVNISAQQIKRKFNLIKCIESLLDEFKIDPRLLELEITEGVFVEDTKHSLAVLGGLHHMGVKFAIDDFGKGFSSFNYLYRLPADKIKIDRSFIAGLPDNIENATIVKSMISMLHYLGKKVIAEGAETQEEIEFLKKEKCDIVQGYYYYKPMLADEFITLMKNL